jgi:uncharacterized protein (TIGR04255 family)
MVITAAKAQLVELTAELRWDARSIDDGLDTQFGELAGSYGLTRCGRTVTAGDRAGPYQPVMQYRPTDPAEPSPLYRLGRGMFSATALPPYASWSGFEPKVRDGLAMLDRAFRSAGKDVPRFNVATMRYVDAFHASPRGEPTLVQFAEALGCRVQLHSGLRRVCTDPRHIAAQIRLTIPVAPGEMTIAIVEGTIENEQAVIMDKTVTIIRDIGANATVALNALVEARGPIHDVFVDLMQNLDELMRRSMS